VDAATRERAGVGAALADCVVGQDVECGGHAGAGGGGGGGFGGFVNYVVKLVSWDVGDFSLPGFSPGPGGP
jgi:hypothetical protein